MTPGGSIRRVPDLRRLPFAYLVVAAVVPLLLLAVVSWYVLVWRDGPSPTAIGRTAPDFSLVDLDGAAITLDDLRGRPVVVYFWASWCPPCVEQFPMLREAVERHADDGLAVVGIVVDDSREAARGFMERHGGTWPAAMDPGGEVARAYRVFAPPETYFVARDGTIVARQIGQFSERSLREKLAAIIDAP